MSRVGRPKREPRELSLADLLGLGVLASLYPANVIDEVLRECGRVETRKRLLPSRVVVYYVMAMGLYGSSGYREIFRLLTDGPRAAVPSSTLRTPQKSAIAKARARVGSKPLQLLFERIVTPLATERTRGAWYRGWRLMSLDGSTMEVADTPANEEFFGRPGVSRGEQSAFPRLRWIGLGECGTRAVVKFGVAPYGVGEGTMAMEILPCLRPGMLCMCDRGFFSFDRWEAGRATGADLLWRARNNAILKPHEHLSDGSYLSRVYPSWQARRRGTPFGVVRVVDYCINDEGRPQAAPRYRLMTTILEADRAPAVELARLYAQRWEVELTIREIKSPEAGGRLVLRSKKPDGVIQELYGRMLVHYAVRWLMHQAALSEDIDPDRLSFLHSVKVVRRNLSQPASFSPQ